MTPRQIELARHALGLDGKRKRSYRNHYCIGSGAPDYDEWMKMFADGMAIRRVGNSKSGIRLFGGDDMFHLTRQGAEAALRKGEKLDPEDFPSIKRATEA